MSLIVFFLILGIAMFIFGYWVGLNTEKDK
jgi:hypothetical protein